MIILDFVILVFFFILNLNVKIFYNIELNEIFVCYNKIVFGGKKFFWDVICGFLDFYLDGIFIYNERFIFDIIFDSRVFRVVFSIVFKKIIVLLWK